MMPSPMSVATEMAVLVAAPTTVSSMMDMRRSRRCLSSLGTPASMSLKLQPAVRVGSIPFDPSDPSPNRDAHSAAFPRGADQRWAVFGIWDEGGSHVSGDLGWCLIMAPRRR